MEVKIVYRVFIVVISAFAFLLLDSCKKEESDPIPEPSKYGFIAVCEGNFNWGNSSITSYDEAKGELNNNLFENVNGFSLGDVAQSIGETDDKYFIVVNNSSKIEVVSKSDFTSLYTINDLGSPRYFQAINDSIAYVSDLWNDVIHIINYNTGNLEGEIAVNGWSEQMVQLEDSVYVGLYATNSIGIVNTNNHELVDEIQLNLPPISMRLDKHNILWVLASEYGGASALYRINVATREIELDWEFTDITLSFIDLPIDSDHLYMAYSSGLITKISLTQSPLVTNLFAKEFDGLYGFNVNEDGEVYIMEAHDFVQNGTITKYNKLGEIQFSIESGINPNAIIFR